MSVRLNAHTRGNPEGGGDGRKDSNGDVQNLLPEFVLVHGSVSFWLENVGMLRATLCFHTRMRLVDTFTQHAASLLCFVALSPQL